MEQPQELLEQAPPTSNNSARLSFLREQFFNLTVRNAEFTPSVFMQLAESTNLEMKLIERYYKTYKTIQTAVFREFEFIPAAIQFLDKNRHPSIREMIWMSENFHIPYKSLFRRWEDYRYLRNEQCPENDTCQKVQAYIKKTWVFKGVLDAPMRKRLEKEFETAKTVSRGNKIYIGYLHLIMEKTDLEPTIIEQEFMTWKSNNIVVRECVTSALLLEIDVAVSPNWEDVEEWAKKYNLDTDYVYKKVLEQKNVSFLEGEDDMPCCSTFAIDSELERFFIDTEEVKEEAEMPTTSGEGESFLPEIKISTEVPFEEEVVICEVEEPHEKTPVQQYPWEDNFLEITQHISKPTAEITVRDVLNISSKLGFDAITALKEYQFRAGLAVESLEAFENNLHPSILEMIEISEKSHLEYRDVFRKFETLRSLKKVSCEPGDICQKVRSFFIYHNYESREKVDIDALYSKFEWLEASGKTLTLGYQHLIMEQTDICAKKVKANYDLWDMMYGKVKVQLVMEIQQNMPPTWEQVNEWSQKYGVPCSRVCSLIDAQLAQNGQQRLQLQALAPPTSSTSLTPQEIVAKINEQFKFGAQKDSKSKESAPIALKMKSCPEYHQFLGDLIYYRKNPHPSIQEMIDISTACKVAYSTVFRRFAMLRVVSGDVCLEDDTCEKVRKFFHPHYVPTGILDETTVQILIQEFEKMSPLPYKILQGHVHLLMELTNLSAGVVKKEFSAWRKIRPVKQKAARKNVHLKISNEAEPPKKSIKLEEPN